MPRVCFNEKPVINTFYDDVEVCKRGGKKKAKKVKPHISNVNKVIVNLTHANRRRLVAPKQQFANQPKALQSITYSNPIAPSHFDNHPRSTHNNPMKIFRDTVEEKIPTSVPTFKTLENPSGITPADSRAQRAIPSRIPSAGVMSSQPPRPESTLQKALGALPAYFPPTGRDNIPLPRPAQEDIARPSNFVPLVAAQPEPREVQMQRLYGQPIHGFGAKISNDHLVATQQKLAEIKAKREAHPDYITPSSNRAQYYNPESISQPQPQPKAKGLSEKQYAFIKSHQDQKEPEPSKKRGGSVF